MIVQPERMVMDELKFPVAAVIGGFWQLDVSTAAAAKKAGRLLGAELAKAGFHLAVYFSNDESLEPHVVSGYVAAQNEGVSSGAIYVRYAESQRGQIKFIEQDL